MAADEIPALIHAYKYTLGQAGRATGKSKVTISRAIKAGKISAIKAADGSYSIEPAELHRVYPATGAAGVPLSLTAALSSQPSLQLLQLHERLAKAEAERDLLTDEVFDLRRRLDTEAEERRRLTAVLTDQRRGWWSRMFGR